MQDNEKFIRKQLLTYLKKNQDYGDSFLESLKKHDMIAYIIRAEDKINRLINLHKSDKIEVEDEKIIDTLLDLYNYSVLAYVFQGTGDNKLSDVLIAMNAFLEDDCSTFVNFLEIHDLLTDSNYDVLYNYVKSITRY